jgi:hypothetical protein
VSFFLFPPSQNLEHDFFEFVGLRYFIVLSGIRVVTQITTGKTSQPRSPALTSEALANATWTINAKPKMIVPAIT